MPNDNDWSLSPDDWFIATVRNRKDKFMFLALTNKQDVFASNNVVQFPRGHECLVKPGDSAAVRIEASTRGSTPWAALEVVFENEYALEEQERGTVQWWSKSYGMVQRECGCWQFVTIRESKSFEPGDDVIISDFKESRNADHPGEIATSIERRTKMSSNEINYSNELNNAALQVEIDKQAAQNQRVWFEVLDRHMLQECDANFGVLHQWSSGQMSIESCEAAIKNRRSSLAWTTNQKLIEEIIDLLRDNTTEKTNTAWALKQQKTWLAGYSLKQLRERRRALIFKRDHPTAASAREYLAAARAPEEQPRLPDEWTAARIKAAPPWQIKALIRSTSCRAVNDRLFGRN